MGAFAFDPVRSAAQLTKGTPVVHAFGVGDSAATRM